MWIIDGLLSEMYFFSYLLWMQIPLIYFIIIVVLSPMQKCLGLFLLLIIKFYIMETVVQIVGGMIVTFIFYYIIGSNDYKRK